MGLLCCDYWMELWLGISNVAEILEMAWLCQLLPNMLDRLEILYIRSVQVVLRIMRVLNFGRCAAVAGYLKI